MAEDSNADIAHRLQEKFDFYFLALAFTVLGLAIQTAKFGHGKAADLAEILGWLLLLTSGLVGLSRLEWQPQLFHIFSFQEDSKAVVREANSWISKGVEEARVAGRQEMVSVAGLRDKHQAFVDKFGKEASQLQARGLAKYRWQRRTFVGGLVALMLARGLPAIVRLAGYELL